MVVLLIAATAFFVAVEFSLVAVDRSEAELKAAEGDRRSGLVAASLRRLSFHLSGVQLGITVCSVGLGVLAGPNIATLLRGPVGSVFGEARSQAISVALALLLATVVQMLLGELIPKAVAVARPLGTARFLAPVERVYSGCFRPIIVLFGAAADRIVRLFGVEPAEELTHVRSRHDLAKLVEASGAEGTLAAAEVDLLSRTFRFREKTVAEVLTPRTAIEALHRDATGGELIDLSVATGHSRFLVYGADLDDVIGLVNVKSLFEYGPVERERVRVSELCSEAVMVPESQSLGRLLVDMRRDATALVVVLDEYGGTAGIATMEDLVEEIVGEIHDEYDVSSRSGGSWSRDGVSILAGRLNLEEVEEATGLTLPDGGYETLAGFVLDRLGRIPTVGDGFEFQDWQFEVMQMDRKRVAAVRLTEPVGTPEGRTP